MINNQKGLKHYDNLDLSKSKNEDELLGVYKDWAPLYDTDNDNLLGTVSQPNTVQIFHEHIKDCKLKIIDVGCGTGLVGLELQNRGFSNFDGIDISQEMIDIAQGRGYNSLFLGNLNKSLPIDSNSYDAALCVGVFTHGHVGPERFSELVRIVKPEGIICFTINENVYESSGFDIAIKHLESENVWEVLDIKKHDYMVKKNVKGIYCVVKVT
ncbi:MAG: ubiquinone/menaquinone biosynthesis C-methylase UbiE [Luteibaculaceae bacterium]|jgi:ubiquinone/menaquinone biosynthesis C-methylase UbiE